MPRLILPSFFRPFALKKVTNPYTFPIASALSHPPAFFSCFTSFSPAAAPRSERRARETGPSLPLISRDSLAHPLFFSQAKDLWISIATKSKPLITPVGTPILISCLFF